MIFASYLLLAATSHKSLAGLETLFPGMTDLALTDVQTGACEDFRLQLWRASGVHCFLFAWRVACEAHLSVYPQFVRPRAG